MCGRSLLVAHIYVYTICWLATFSRVLFSLCMYIVHVVTFVDKIHTVALMLSPGTIHKRGTVR